MLLALGVLNAQTSLPSQTNDAVQIDAAQPEPGAPTVAASSEGPIGRWLTLDKVDFSMRYRNSASASGGRNFDSAQQRSLISGKFKFDSEGKYGIGFRASSGRYFNWAYATFGGARFADTSFQNGSISSNPQYRARVFHYLPYGGPVPETRGWDFT